MLANIQYIQDEHSALLVAGTTNPAIAKNYMLLENFWDKLQMWQWLLC